MSISVEDVRVYTKDIPEFNILLEGEQQSSEALINLSRRLAVQDYNAASPVSDYTDETIPQDCDTLVLYGILHHLANSEAERQLRNQITYNAQGLNAGIDDKFVLYSQLAQSYKALFDQKVKENKAYHNAMQCWGHSDSPYAVLNSYDYRT